MTITLDIEQGRKFILERNTITSIGLKEACPYCNSTECFAYCDGSQGDIDGLESEEDMQYRKVWNFAIEAIESLILAQARTIPNLIVQKDLTVNPLYLDALKTTIDALSNNLQEY